MPPTTRWCRTRSSRCLTQSKTWRRASLQRRRKTPTMRDSTQSCVLSLSPRKPSFTSTGALAICRVHMCVLLCICACVCLPLCGRRCRYHCYTCGLAENTGVCSICAKVCHRDHELAYSKYGAFFCDCGARGEAHCKVSASVAHATHETCSHTLQCRCCAAGAALPVRQLLVCV